jgi:hypothetical protein
VQGYQENASVARLRQAEAQREALPHSELISLDEPQIWVPAQNIYYDPVESSTWW